MDPKLIAPLLMAVFVLWAIYRRTRRVFGRQRIVERRMWGRIAVLALVGALVLVGSVHSIRLAAALLGGIACGAALGYVGLRYTRFEVTPEGRFYTPHAYIGLVVTALFIGRLLYRFLMMYSGAHGLGPYAYQRSPLTLAIFGALVGYYVLYYLGVLLRSRPRAIMGQRSSAQLP